MTNSIIESMAASLKDREDTLMTFDTQSDSDFPDWRLIAKAAIEALDITILPWDAEPEVGDLIDISAASICNLSYVPFSSVKELNEIINPPETTNYFSETGCRIIQRNGKPVLQEEKPE